MEFLCPVVPGAAFTWAHLAHLALLGVVGGIGLPLVGVGFIAFRRSAPVSASAPIAVMASDGMTRDLERRLAAVPVALPARPAVPIPRRRR